MNGCAATSEGGRQAGRAGPAAGADWCFCRSAASSCSSFSPLRLRGLLFGRSSTLLGERLDLLALLALHALELLLQLPELPLQLLHLVCPLSSQRESAAAEHRG